MAPTARTTHALALDFGTMHCRVASVSLDQYTSTPPTQQTSMVDVITNEDGRRVTDSMISFAEDETLVGDAASTHLLNNAPNTVKHVMKSLLGVSTIRTQEELDQFAARERWGFRTVLLNGETGEIGVEVQEAGKQTQYTVHQLAVMLLQRMKSVAEKYLGKKVSRVVANVPIGFDDERRGALIRAFEDAGMKVMSLINDPTAAVMAYGLDFSDKKAKQRSKAEGGGETPVTTPTSEADDPSYSAVISKRLAVAVDIGALSSRASLLSIEDGIIEVVDSQSVPIGGEAFGEVLASYCIQEIQRKYQANISKSVRSMTRLRAACESAKIILSNSQNTTIRCESLFEGMDYSTQITRARFEMLAKSLFQQCTSGLIQKLLNGAAITDKSRVTDVLLMGGGTSIPKIEKLMTDFFSSVTPNVTVHKSTNPMEVVVSGAALQAATLSTSKTKNRVDRNNDNGTLQIKVTPHTIGIELAHGQVKPLIYRNTRLPAQSDPVMCSVSRDGQRSLMIKIVEGERMFAKECREMGYVIVNAVDVDVKRGETKFEVLFSIDIDGTLTVTARDTVTQKEHVLQVKPLHKEETTKEKVDEEVRIAKSKLAEDLSKKQVVDALLNLESYIFEIRKRDRLMANDDIRQLTEDTLTWIKDNTSETTTREQYVAKHHEVHAQLAALRKK